MLKPNLENNGQLISISEDGKLKKVFKCRAKRIINCDNPHTPMQTPTTSFATPLLSCFGSPIPSLSRLRQDSTISFTTLLLSYLMLSTLLPSYLIPALSSHPVPTSLSYPRPA